MKIRSHIKINTVLLVSFVFLFRILFVNVCLLTGSEDNRLADSHSSTLLKKRRRADMHTKAAFEIAAAEDVCEESSGNEEQGTKIYAPVILPWFHSVLNKLIPTFSANRPLDSIKCDLYPKKHLAISVLRI